MKAIRFLRSAELEMLDAARYYELQAPGLGDKFLDKVDSAVRDISEHPERWPVIRNNIRRRLIHRFPYALLYRIDPEEVIIQATMHLHRHPDYWIDRL
jgi:plasmid stabilization system protein ParE